MEMSIDQTTFYFLSLATAIIIQVTVVTYWAGRLAAKIDTHGERLARIEYQLDVMNGGQKDG